MDEEGFDVKIIHTKGILRRLLAKFRSRMNTIKCENSKTNGLHRRILTIYSWTIFYISTLMCVKYPPFSIYLQFRGRFVCYQALIMHTFVFVILSGARKMFSNATAYFGNGHAKLPALLCNNVYIHYY
jgi:hypothetical protein